MKCATQFVFLIIGAALLWPYSADAAKRALTATEQKYFCSGECDVERERCSCLSPCKENRNCCTDYEESCNNGKSWKDTECAASEDMGCPAGYTVPPVVLLSIDGYRDIYYDRQYTPTITKLESGDPYFSCGFNVELLDHFAYDLQWAILVARVYKIATCGVKVPYMRSAYPTKTFPNHYTIVTGLYPESHGIIANTFYNHDRDEQFRLGKESSFEPGYWHGEPIWVTVSNQGLKSATYFWPGSDVNITRYPDYYYKYDESVDNEERVYQALEWLDLPEEERPSFVALYTHIVDSAGHLGGPFSALVNTTLPKADDMVEMIMNGLRDRGLDTCVNFIITSDHGMADVDCPADVRFIDQYGINMSEVYFDGGPYGRVGKSPDKSLWNRFDAVETKKKLECMKEETHWEAFLKYEYLPKRYHYANDPWIEPVHLVAEDEYWIEGETEDDYACELGQHGFDNSYVDMRAFFTAHGPGVKRAYSRTLPVENIEIYNLIADLLALDPAPNNGTRGGISDVMKDPPTVSEGDGVDAQVCAYPDATNTPTSDLGCQSCQGVSEEEANQMLDLSQSEMTKYNSENMLLGQPKILNEEAEYCLLTQRSYVAAYDKKLKMPRYSSFVLEPTSKQKDWEEIACSRPDIRVAGAESTACSDYQANSDMTYSFLYSPNLSNETEISDATLTSNMMPTYTVFAEIWDFMSQSFQNWANLYNGVQVEVGPIFDYNYDGLADTNDVIKNNGTFVTDGDSSSTPVPTHYFIIATRCRDRSSGNSIENCVGSLDNIEQLSFIVPNYKEAPCHEGGQAMSEWLPRSLAIHIARVRDIELLTRISFLSTWTSGGTEGQSSLLSAIRTKLILAETSGSWLQDFINDVKPTEVTTTPGLTTTSGAARSHQYVTYQSALYLAAVAFCRILF